MIHSSSSEMKKSLPHILYKRSKYEKSFMGQNKIDTALA